MESNTMICGCGRALVPRLDASGKKIGVTHETIEDEEHHSEYFRSLTVKPEASHPAPAPIVGEKEEPLTANSLKQVSDINVADLPDQAVPEELVEWIDAQTIGFSFEGLMNYLAWAKSMYHKMQEEIAGWKETASLINKEGSLIQADLSAAREEAAAYRKALEEIATDPACLPEILSILNRKSEKER